MTERGTGRVAGLTRETTQTVLHHAADLLSQRKRGASPAEMRDTLLAVSPRLTDAQLAGLAQALTRTPGVLRTGHGRYKVTTDAVRFLKHRDWRMPSGRLDLASAEMLVELVNDAEGSGRTIPSALAALRDRAERGAAQLRRRDRRVMRA